MTEGTVTDVILSRTQGAERLNSMIVWSIAAHIVLFTFMVFMPASWRGAVDEGPRTVMTISLGGAPGPRNGGLTTMGGRTVQAPAGSLTESPILQLLARQPLGGPFGGRPINVQ